ncbi:MAG TPA: hypothetical protein VFS40_14075 [Gemmatimonadales bacterium]|nr:hypothetical protein [Gemmatimonadales bacterium]
MLHLRCGSDIEPALGAAGLPGGFLAYADPVAQGPTPLTSTADEFHRLRAGFLADAYGVPVDDALARLATADAALALAGVEDEVVLWFEHDLFDQAVLVRLLAHFAAAPRRPRWLSLVTLDAHPEIERFLGLGQLDAPQLAALFARRVPVGDAALALGRRAWEAWRAPTPLALQALLDADTGALPFLAGAVRRLLEELPWTTDGLALTERLALEGLEAGHTRARALFAWVQARERAPWLGDAMFFYVLRTLDEGAEPLLRARGEWPRLDGTGGDPALALTETGARVLAEREDRVRCCGVDRWVAGTWLEGREVAWRWDPAQRRVVRG